MKHTIHVPGTRCTLTCNIENVPKVQTKLEKLAKTKPRKPTIRVDKRAYPLFGRYMDTASYTRAFWDLNFTAASPDDCIAFFEPLSTRPQEWPQEPLYEEIKEDQGDTMSYDFGASESLPAWLTAGVPPEWIKD